MGTFRYDAHPMGMLIASIAAMGTFYPESNPALEGSDLYQRDLTIRNRNIFRILGKMPTIAANSYRHRIGRPYNNPSFPADLKFAYIPPFIWRFPHLHFFFKKKYIYI